MMRNPITMQDNLLFRDRRPRLGRGFWISLVAGAALLRCVMSSSQGVRACVSGSSLSLGPRGGPLRILPSRIPEVEIDTATWAFRAGMHEPGGPENLEFRLSLRSRHDSLDRQVVALFELRKRNGETVLYADDRLVLTDRGNDVEFLTDAEHKGERQFHR
jgi:hypothetical protein